MKSTRTVLTIACMLSIVPMASARTQTVKPAESTQTTKPAESMQTQATLNSNPRQTPYSSLPTQNTQSTETTETTQTAQGTKTTQATAPHSVSPLSEGVGGVLAVGDTVVIRRDNTRYMTGERMSTWVYDVTHTVRQVDSKYHPNGVLLNGINSWVSPEAVEKKGTQATTLTQTPPAPSSERGSADSTTSPQEVGTTVSAQEQPAPATTEPTQVTENTQTTEPTQSTEPTQATQGAATTASRSDTPLSEEGAGGVHRFTIGLRGGYANNMFKATDATHPLGYDAMLDLQYAHYWAKAADKCQLGLLVGIGVGYLQSGLQQQAFAEQFTANTSDGNILYTVTADEVKDKTGQVQLEVPVMFSMITPRGFFLNAGPRILLPVYTPSHQSPIRMWTLTSKKRACTW